MAEYNDLLKLDIVELERFTLDIVEKEDINVKFFTLDRVTKPNLDDLDDVNISNAQENEVLTYDGEEWINSPASGGLAGEGLSKDENNYLNVNVDDVTIEISSADTLQVKDAGIDENKLSFSVAGNGILGGAGSPLSINVDDSTLEIGSGEELRIKDLGIINDKIADGTIGEEKLDIANSPTLGYFARWNGTKIEWADVDVIAVLDTDIKKEDKSSECDGNNVTFTLTNIPVANSVKVFLNGLIQQEGSGADYTISGTTITFVIAPESDDILVILYIAQS